MLIAHMILRFSFLFCYLAFVAVPSVKAAPPSTLWEKTFGGPQFDVAASAVALRDGGLVIAGRTTSQGAGNWDGWLLHLDSDGEVVWDRTYGNLHDNLFSDVAKLSDGGFVIVGTTVDRDTLQVKGWILRTDPIGDVIWEKKVGDGFAMLNGIAVFPDGGMVAVGSKLIGNLKSDAWVLRMSSDGKVLWHETLGMISDDEAADAVAIVNNSQIVIAVNSLTYEGETESRIYRLHPTGTLKWDHRFVGDNELRQISALTGLQDHTIAAGLGLTDKNDAEARVTRIDGEGGIRWRQVYGSREQVSAISSVQGGRGFFVVGTKAPDPWLARLDAAGDVAWEITFPLGKTTKAKTAVGFVDGTFAVIGNQYHEKPNRRDLWVARINKDPLLIARQLQARAVPVVENIKKIDTPGEIAANDARLLGEPHGNAKIVGTLRPGLEVRIAGILPTGWVLITEQGVPIGYTYRNVFSAETLVALGFDKPVGAVQSQPTTDPITATAINDALPKRIADALVEQFALEQELLAAMVRSEPARKHYRMAIGQTGPELNDRQLINLISKYRPDRTDILRTMGERRAANIDLQITNFVLPRFWEIAEGNEQIDPNSPFLGFLFQTVAVDDEGVIALCARPATYTSGYRQTFLFAVRQEGSGRLALVGSYSNDIAGHCVENWPTGADFDGWQPIEIERPVRRQPFFGGTQ